MLEPLIYEKSINTPKVIFDKQNNDFEISGRSIHEDAAKFFEPLLNWMDCYITQPNLETILTINLDYFNSASARRLVHLFAKLESIFNKGFDVKIIWMHEEFDELMIERGEELQSTVKIPFELKPF